MTVQAGSGGQATTTEAEASNAGSFSGAAASTSSTGAVASGGGSAGTGAVASTTAVRSEPPAAAAGEGKSASAETEALRARVSELEGLLNDTVSRKQKAKTEAEQATARANAAEGALRQRASVDAIAEAVPEAHRQAAIDALYRFQAEGEVDLSGEDRKAVVENAIAKLKEKRASYFEAPKSALPRMPGVNTGGVTKETVGMTNSSGERIL